ncbi:MAG: hypothetical protein H7Z15_23860 [Rhizobacter sp.]|nr:hypothetical protein [Rhizobacter sp.]
MHASPPFQMIVRHFGVWRVVGTMLVASAAAVVAVWALQAMERHAVWVVIASVLLALSSTPLLAHAWRLPAMTLRWDSEQWQLAASDAAGHEPPPSGCLVVAVDFGGWMLLHFKPDNATVLQRGTWLPVQRRGHEADWHALRCTVYCARPVSLPTVAPF